MVLDLILLPLRGPREMSATLVNCQDRLSFDRDSRIFSQLTDFSHDNKPTIKANPIPPKMWVETYEDEGIERIRDDYYGNELTFVYAKQMKKLKITNEASPKNKAIMAFVRALPNDTPIILLWQ